MYSKPQMYSIRISRLIFYYILKKSTVQAVILNKKPILLKYNIL